MAIRDWKWRGLFRQTSKDTLHASDSFFGVGSTAISPKARFFLVRIVITEVILTRTTFFYKKSTFDKIEPHLRLFSHDFKVVHMGVDVVKANRN